MGQPRFLWGPLQDCINRGEWTRALEAVAAAQWTSAAVTDKTMRTMQLGKLSLLKAVACAGVGNNVLQSVVATIKPFAHICML